MTQMLGIDTSHHVAVGLARDGEPVVSEVVADTRTRGEVLTPLIQRLCASAGIAITGIDTYAVGMGSGPFTGLHVGVVTARTLATVTGRPLHGVCSLSMIAIQWQDTSDKFVVTSDTHRRRLYWVLCHDGIYIGEPRVSAPGAIPDLPAAGPILDDPAGPHHLDTTVLAAHWVDLPSVDREPFYLWAADTAVPRARGSTLPHLRVPR